MAASFLSIAPRFMSVLLMIGLLGSQVRADVPVTYTDAGRALFRFDAPDFWTIRTGGARLLAAPGTEDERDVSRLIGLSPTTDPRIWVGFVSPKGISNFQQGVEYLRDIGPSLVKDAVTTTRKETRLNGLKAASFSGAGRRNGKAVNYTAILIDLPGNRIAIAVVVMEPGIDTDTLTAVNAMLNSFHAVR